jgi:hypothetical protein
MNTYTLQEGGKARIKNTAKVVEVKRVSQHGIAVVAFKAGGEFFMLRDRLIPVGSTATASVQAL